MSKIGLYTVKKAGLISSGLALNVLLIALLLLSTPSAHAGGRGWHADRYGGYFGSQAVWKVAGSRQFRRSWGLNRGGFNRGWRNGGWRGARRRNSQIFVGGAVSAIAGNLLYSSTLHRPTRTVTVVRDTIDSRSQATAAFYSPRVVSTPRPAPLVSQSGVISIPAASSAVIGTPATRWLSDLAGNCYRITTNAAGEELREQQDPSVCAAF